MKKQSVLAPGAVLKESLDTYQLTPAKLADDVQLSQSAIRQILSNKTKISINVGLRLSKYFGNPGPYWIQLQQDYDLAESANDEEFSAILKSIPKVQKPPVSKKDTASKASAKKAAPKNAAPKKAAAKKPAAKKSPKAPAEKDDAQESSW
ncbi:MAG: HigA family addiction module antidote protein [Spirochaetaceae bacterium]|jgi:addiction module HigA family antidote|nr:HigA family addiction module antidote protein [Spirochaetaceae bacterium]